MSLFLVCVGVCVSDLSERELTLQNADRKGRNICCQFLSGRQRDGLVKARCVCQLLCER